MAMTINTNTVSLNAQRNLSLSGSTLGTTMQRLSSGLRVNSAKDDAAGLAIAERMNAQSRGLSVAARNANDGISLAQTAEGALGKLGDMLQRMRELSVQSSNATNNAADRAALQAEVSQLRSEIDRVAKTTTFNGQKILDGSFAGGVFQVGASAGDNITVGGITNARAEGLGLMNYGSSRSLAIDVNNLAGFDKDLAGLSMSVGGKSIELGDFKAASSGQERLGQMVAAINAKTSDSGVTAFLAESATPGSYYITLKSDSTNVVRLKGFESLSPAPKRDYPSVATLEDFAALQASFGTSAEGGAVAGDSAKDAKRVLSVLNELNAITDEGTQTAIAAAQQELGGLLVNTPSGVAYKDGATGAAEFKKALDAIDRSAWKLDPSVAEVLEAGGAVPWAPNTPMAPSESTPSLEAAMDQAFALNADSTAEDFNRAVEALTVSGGWSHLNVNAFSEKAAPDQEDVLKAVVQLQKDIDPAGLSIAGASINQRRGLDALDVGTQDGAWEAIKQIDSAIDQVNASRASLGALQIRFEKSIENIDIQNENIIAARGRIVDADFATETANLSRAQILQQAGTAMVAQANQLPQNVLSLLQ